MSAGAENGYESALVLAICAKQFDSVDIIINYAIDSIDSMQKELALLWLIAYKQHDRAKRLLTHLKTCPILVNPHTGQTALLKALKHGYTDIALRLIELGADVNHYDRGNYSAMRYAYERGNFQLIEKIILLSL